MIILIDNYRLSLLSARLSHYHRPLRPSQTLLLPQDGNYIQQLSHYQLSKKNSAPRSG